MAMTSKVDSEETPSGGGGDVPPTGGGGAAPGGGFGLPSGGGGGGAGLNRAMIGSAFSALASMVAQPMTQPRKARPAQKHIGTTMQ